MGAGIHQWTLYIENGEIGIAMLDDLFEYQNLYIVKRFGQEDDSKARAQAAAYEMATKSRLPLQVPQED